MTYQLTDFVIETAKTDKAAALAFFLLDNTGSVFGEWSGNMKVSDQRKLFGFVIGRGTIRIDGNSETVFHIVTVCFGTMTDCAFSRSWAEICKGGYRDYPHIHKVK